MMTVGLCKITTICCLPPVIIIILLFLVLGSLIAVLILRHFVLANEPQKRCYNQKHSTEIRQQDNPHISFQLVCVIVCFWCHTHLSGPGSCGCVSS
jgi:hypothetical protein